AQEIVSIRSAKRRQYHAAHAEYCDSCNCQQPPCRSSSPHYWQKTAVRGHRYQHAYIQEPDHQLDSLPGIMHQQKSELVAAELQGPIRLSEKMQNGKDCQTAKSISRSRSNSECRVASTPPA